ncbi:MAG: peptidoglycan-binding domain-containing protein [Stackebrandtia sp.]
MHISIRHTTAAENNAANRFDRKRRVTLPHVDLSRVVAEFERGAQENLRGVRLIQRALNAKADADLVLDGYAGTKTRAAYAAWERAIGNRNQDGVPDRRGLIELGQHRFRVAS